MLKTLLRISASVCLALMMLACDAGTPAATAPAAAKPRFDHEISSDVKAKIEKDSRLRGAKIDVMCDAGTVILSGSVDSREQFGIAQVLAAGTEGAKGVINRLQITTSAEQQAPGAPQATPTKNP